MVEFFQILFLSVVGGRRGRQEVKRVLTWEQQQYRRMHEDTQADLDMIHDVLSTSRAATLARWRRHKEALGA